MMPATLAVVTAPNLPAALTAITISQVSHARTLPPPLVILSTAVTAVEERKDMEVGKMYSVPNERLYPKVVNWAKRIHDKFSTGEADALLVAQLLGHSSVGGAFNSKVAAMTSYGVVDRRLGKIRVTDIGKKIVSPAGPIEKVEGVRSSLLKVALWERLYQDFTAKGLELPEDFWTELAKICDIPPGEAKGKAEWVAKAYEADFSFLKSAEKESSSGGAGIPVMTLGEEPSSSQRILGELAGQISIPASGQRAGQIIFMSQEDRIQLSVPRSARHIGMLRTFIDNALKAIEVELAAGTKHQAARGKAPKPAKKRHRHGR